MTRPNPPWVITHEWAMAANLDQLQDAYIRLRIAEQRFMRDGGFGRRYEHPEPLPKMRTALHLVTEELIARGVELPDVAEFDEGKVVM